MKTKKRFNIHGNEMAKISNAVIDIRSALWTIKSWNRNYGSKPEEIEELVKFFNRGKLELKKLIDELYIDGNN